MNATNLNPLFIDQVGNFAHLLPISGAALTKADFLQEIKKQYCTSNPKTNLFCIAVEKSTFDTIKIDRVNECLLFNQ